MSDTQEKAEGAEKLGAPEERHWPIKTEFTPEMLAEMEKLLPSKLQSCCNLLGRLHPLRNVQ